MIQTLITAGLVGSCACYAAWALMPASWRMALAHWLLRWHPQSAWLRQAARAPGGCGGGDGCHGCDNNQRQQPGAGPTQVIRIHRRRPD